MPVSPPGDGGDDQRWRRRDGHRPITAWATPVVLVGNAVILDLSAVAFFAAQYISVLIARWRLPDRRASVGSGSPAARSARCCVSTTAAPSFQWEVPGPTRYSTGRPVPDYGVGSRWLPRRPSARGV